jgi:hypothetical protein
MILFYILTDMNTMEIEESTRVVLHIPDFVLWNEGGLRNAAGSSIQSDKKSEFMVRFGTEYSPVERPMT